MGLISLSPKVVHTKVGAVSALFFAGDPLHVDFLLQLLLHIAAVHELVRQGIAQNHGIGPQLPGRTLGLQQLSVPVAAVKGAQVSSCRKAHNHNPVWVHPPQSRALRRIRQMASARSSSGRGKWECPGADFAVA